MINKGEVICVASPFFMDIQSSNFNYKICVRIQVISF